MTASMWALAVVAVVVLAWVTLHTAARVRRLDRLHARTDAARAGMEAALERRAAAALVVASVPGAAGEHPDRLRSAVLACRAAHHSGDDREAAENTLGRLLATVHRAMLPPGVLEELVDAEQLVILARRVHNDAVRDTLGLRSRRLVRWLHLAGSAPLPRYFDIADPEPGVTTAAPVQSRTASAGRAS